MRLRSQDHRERATRRSLVWWFGCSAAAAIGASALLVLVVAPASSRNSREAIEEVAGAEELHSGLAGLADEQLAFLLTGDESHLRNFEATAADFRAATGRLARLATDEEAATLQRVLAPYGRFVAGHARIVARHRQGDVAGAVALATGVGRADRLEVEQRIDDIRARVVAESHDELAATHRRSVALTLILLGLSMASGGAAIVFGRVLRRMGGDEARRVEHRRLAEAQRIARLGSWERELGSSALSWSDELYRILGHEPGAIVPTRETFYAQVHPDDRHRLRAAADRVSAEEPTFEVVHRIVRPTGEVRWVTTQGELRPGTEGRPPAIAGTSLDVTDRQEALEEVGRAQADLARQEAEMRHRAYHDALTALPNRALLLETVDASLADRAPGSRHVAVLVLDLDGFKRVNDSLGHGIGDLLLIHVAQRLGACVGADGRDPRHMVARLGGDEFGVVLTGLDPHEAQQMAERVVDACAAPFAVDGRCLTVSASVGLTIGGDGPTATELLRDADVAMYAAKEQGRGRFVVFDPAMRAAVLDRLALETELATAVEAGDLAVHYQPIVDPSTVAIIKVEALARWPHPTRGYVPPDRFVPMAEETGLIVRLGEWVLREACRELSGRLGRRPDLQVAVNLSARQLREPGLADAVFRALSDHGLGPRHLVLEVTESVVMDHGSDDLAPLQRLRAAGVGVAIDDFGTGHSSLSRLRALPITELKIDKSFIDEIDRDGERAPVVAAIIALGHSLGLRIVAEGVETAGQLSSLVRLGCDRIQGYLFSRPLAPAELGELLAFAAPFTAAAAGATALPDHIDEGVMAAVASAMAGGGDLEATVRPLLAEVARLAGLESAYLTSVDLEGQQQEVLAALNGADLTIPPGAVVPWADTVCRRALEGGPRVSSDVGRDFPDVAAARELGLQSYAMVPVTTPAGLLIGTLCAAGRSPHVVDDQTLAVMEVFSRVIADVLHQGAPLPNRRVLQVVIADDSAAVRRMLRMALDESPGVEVVAEASDGDEAVRVCEAHRPDILLLDVAMPEADGLSALPRLAAVSPSTKVVVVSADSEAHREQALAAGAVAVVDKWQVVDHLPALVAAMA